MSVAAMTGYGSTPCPTMASGRTLGGAVDPATRTAGFTALYDEHMAEIHTYVHRRCQDRALAEDITQDTFLTAVRSVDDPADITIGWLITVARNRLLDVVRRQASYSGKLRLVQPRDGRPDEDDATADRMDAQAAFARLRAEHRVVLAMHYLDELTVAEMASELGISRRTAETAVTRARRALRRELEGSHG